MFQIFEIFSSWLHFVDKKHWTHLETVPFRGASNIKIIISSIILLNRFLHQYSNDIFQFAVDIFKIRHHIFIFAKSLVLLPRVFINIGIHVFVCIGVLGIRYSTTQLKTKRKINLIHPNAGFSIFSINFAFSVGLCKQIVKMLAPQRCGA